LKAVDFKHLTYTYPNSSTPSLTDLSLSIEEGEFVLLVGPSGGGKSTLLRCLNGLVPHFHGGSISGKLSVFDNDIKVTKPAHMADKVGLVFQDPEGQLVMTEVASEVAFGMENLGLPPELIKRRVEESLAITDFPARGQAFIPNLSGGEKQKVVIASLLAMHPRLFALDEPTSQLDPRSAEIILTFVRMLNEELGITVVMAEHRLDRCFHFADRVVLIEDGRISLDLPKREFAASVKDGFSSGARYLPPVSRIFANGRSPTIKGQVPVTVKEGRRVIINLARKGMLHPVKGRVPKKVPLSKRYGPILSVTHLSFRYKNGPPILKDISFKVHPGERLAILGRNGVGKSTLVQHFNGLLRPGKGKVVLDGKDTASATIASLAKVCGLLTQYPGDYLTQRTVSLELKRSLESLKISPREKMRRIEWVAKKLELTDVLDSYPLDLSGGERQRVAMGAMLIRRPRLLVLDEPTRGMDPVNKELLVDLLKELGDVGRQTKKEPMASIVVTHDVEFAASYATRVMVLGTEGIITDAPTRTALAGSLVFSPQVNKVCRGISEGGLPADLLLPEDLRFKTDG